MKRKRYIWGAISVCLLLALITYFIFEDSDIPLKKPQYNKALQNSAFLRMLENYKIIAIAPSSATTLANIQQLKEIQNLNLILPDELISADILYNANTDEKRLAYLKDALNATDPNTIIWALRGGFGMTRLMDGLAELPKPEQEKPVVGFSDITALHLFLSQKWGWKTIHGPVLLDMLTLTIEKDPSNLEKVAELLSGNVKQAEINQLLPLNAAAENLTSISGRLSGGNLTLVQNSIGTFWQIDTKDRILFFEDKDLDGSRIDRIFTHLKQAGLLKDVKAIILGNFRGNDDKSINFALNRFAQESDIPVYKTDEFGHGEKNYPLIYNAESTLSKSQNSEFFKLIMPLN